MLVTPVCMPPVSLSCTLTDAAVRSMLHSAGPDPTPVPPRHSLPRLSCPVTAPAFFQCSGHKQSSWTPLSPSLPNLSALLVGFTFKIVPTLGASHRLHCFLPGSSYHHLLPGFLFCFFNFIDFQREGKRGRETSVGCFVCTPN